MPGCHPPAWATTAAAAPTGTGRNGVRARRRLPQIDRREVAAIFAGGALGTLARAALAESFPQPATAWPWPTFAVNIGAAFLLGYFVTRLAERLPLSSYRRPLLGTGLCGGLSTFSTMQVEIPRARYQRDRPRHAGQRGPPPARGNPARHPPSS